MQAAVTSQNALPPFVLRIIRETFETTIGELEQRHGSHAVTDYTRAALARQMVRLARNGECNPSRLQTQALNCVHL
ncbi:MAG: hypothetical protein ACKVRO_10985 [Micropepsaceae bacterium]